MDRGDPARERVIVRVEPDDVHTRAGTRETPIDCVPAGFDDTIREISTLRTKQEILETKLPRLDETLVALDRALVLEAGKLRMPVHNLVTAFCEAEHAEIDAAVALFVPLDARRQSVLDLSQLTPRFLATSEARNFGQGLTNRDGVADATFAVGAVARMLELIKAANRLQTSTNTAK